MKVQHMYNQVPEYVDDRAAMKSYDTPINLVPRKRPVYGGR